VADAEGPLFELHIAAGKHICSAEAKLDVLSSSPDPQIAHLASELRKVLGEVRRALR